MMAISHLYNSQREILKCQNILKKSLSDQNHLSKTEKNESIDHEDDQARNDEKLWYWKKIGIPLLSISTLCIITIVVYNHDRVCFWRKTPPPPPPEEVSFIDQFMKSFKNFNEKFKNKIKLNSIQFTISN
mmetsp:Transcript_4123/g.6096  ORF Transcript_4123/g.6096 Transcript_4123/m.6096 type:complete len:130 (+) Transcript_4123:78-467(+)